MDGSDSQIQFGELEQSIKSTGCVNLSIDCDGDSMYAETMRAESYGFVRLPGGRGASCSG